jgi:hypothetical protein
VVGLNKIFFLIIARNPITIRIFDKQYNTNKINTMKRLSLTTEQLEIMAEALNGKAIEQYNFIEMISTDVNYIKSFPGKMETYEDFLTRQKNKYEKLVEVVKIVEDKLGW